MEKLIWLILLWYLVYCDGQELNLQHLQNTLYLSITIVYTGFDSKGPRGNMLCA